MRSRVGQRAVDVYRDHKDRLEREEEKRRAKNERELIERASKFLRNGDESLMLTVTDVRHVGWYQIELVADGLRFRFGSCGSAACFLMRRKPRWQRLLAFWGEQLDCFFDRARSPRYKSFSAVPEHEEIEISSMRELGEVLAREDDWSVFS